MLLAYLLSSHLLSSHLLSSHLLSTHLLSTHLFVTNMANTATLIAREALKEALPDLKITTKKTTSSALHPIDFVGNLQLWPNFRAEVLQTFNTQTWSATIIKTKVAGPAALGSISEEHMGVSCEASLQGRLGERVGQVLSAVLKAQWYDLMFCSFRGAELPYEGYHKIPDFAAINQAGTVKIVGEAKVPWVTTHSPSRALDMFMRGREEQFRHLLGQISLYMRETQLKYGFLSSYNETIVLRKTVVGRHWVLEYSPVIYHSDEGNTMRGTVSTLQSLYHIALLCQGGWDFGSNTGTRNQKWTTNRQ
ncbi:uncharacterized protein N7482_002492 [Penicillium canariense]|uniref:Uncharacterized protein n=1 Tax=Penicillium canariense TaxID=189055 RepID=A0A9W9LUI6_9EURO|nr:uncharacterized protein N7482_002492 [Penicillium canariense]KAJ5176615.1 hypothetical protein N7482_002492 [Penicillium canariense]